MAEREINYRQYSCSEEVPAYSIVAIDNTSLKQSGRRVVYTVKKATSSSTVFGATGRMDGRVGVLNTSEDMLVRYTGTLSTGDRVRAKVGDWVVEKNTAGVYTVAGLVERDSLKLAIIRLDPAKGGNKLIKAPSGGIPGRVGTLLGSATCAVWTETSNTRQIQDSGDTLVVYNWATSAVCSTGDRYGIAAWCNSAWYIIAEDCNDAGGTVQASSTTSTTSQTSSDPVSASPTVLASSPVTVFSFGNFHEIRYSSTSTGGGFE
jgi:hypothetical protein